VLPEVRGVRIRKAVTRPSGVVVNHRGINKDRGTLPYIVSTLQRGKRRPGFGESVTHLHRYRHTGDRDPWLVTGDDVFPKRFRTVESRLQSGAMLRVEASCD